MELRFLKHGCLCSDNTLNSRSLALRIAEGIASCLNNQELWIKTHQLTGAPNGSVSQNICSSGKFLLAGRCERNSMSFEGKCGWEKDNRGCLRGFESETSPPPPPLPHPLRVFSFEFCPKANGYTLP